MRHIFFINPRARDGALGREWGAVAHHFEYALEDTEFIVPTSAAHCREMAAKYAQQDKNVCLVSVGGEGTMNMVMNGIVDAGCEDSACMAIVPFGNVNDYAANIGMEKNWQHSLRTLKDGHRQRVGLVEMVTEHARSHSLNIAGTGFGSAAGKMHSVDHKLAWIKGRLKYNLLALRLLMHWRNAPSRLVVDNEVIDGDLTILLGGFSPTLGGFKLVPHADPFGDLMAITYAHNVGKLEILKLMERAKHGAIEASDRIHLLDGRRMLLESMSPLVADVDGEVVDNATHKIEYIAHPQRLRFVVPHSRDSAK